MVDAPGPARPADGDGPRLLLHIGAPKTGSTALQHFLFTNRTMLRQQGWGYPDVSLRGYGHHDLAFMIAGGYPDWAVPADVTLEGLIERLSAAGADDENLVMSSENFYLLADPIRVREALERSGVLTGRSVAILCYLRRQDDAHASWYNQRVKAQGFAGSVADSIRDQDALWDYDAMLGRWADAFGADRLVLRCYQPARLVGGDIRLDVSSVMRIDPPAGALPPERINTGLGRDLLEIQRIINTLPLAPVEKRRFHRQLMALPAGGPTGTEAILSPALRRQLIERYSTGNRRVAERFLGRDTLFDEALADDCDLAGSWPGLSVEEVVRTFGWLLCRTGDGT